MSNTTERLARRAGFVVKKHRRGTSYVDPVTGLSFYDGNRSSKSWQHQRRIESVIRKRDRLGLG
ncbi:hypothetical protein KBZ08_00765 [Cyanobium sp. Candia 9D4]|uniref:hypothetical protein n=1 Tax=Cyanobium sp. Candia 9D4 TaxID=2823707 RepID=UPI0020CF24E8|nr:hypothetical protein [Cyanobium sp. Candia 9D4]MCP9932441.1 hypothetical protein [Cyanobium sp. Candia 9D4]